MGPRFVLLEELGRGSYGVVHRALDTHSGQHFAIKELSARSAAGIGSFKREFRALVDCHHPNLVGLRELIEEDGAWRIVMELVEGEELLRYVRGAPAHDRAAGFDEARLRRALSGMAEGLAALHAYGALHRDLRCSNVRVTAEGRAVLLDFGLVIRMNEQERADTSLVGTAAYMAPEQATEAVIGPAADWYALGVCLFEALTGETPFAAESPFALLAKKQAETAPRASSRAEGVPADLDALCAALLARDPAARPRASEVLRVLGRPEPADPAEGGLGAAAVTTPFAGRAAELAQLGQAFTATRAGSRRLVLIEGESGVGKSELVAELLRRLRREEPPLLCLHGRCFENEQVSYKAFDGCIDDLAAFLRQLPERTCEALLPLRAAVLGQVFPVLRTIPAIAHAPRTHLSAEPIARRLEAFVALAALCATLAAERPLVIVIDDMQWADAESFRLLSALLSFTAAPLPVLILVTIRPSDELDAALLPEVEVLRSQRETTTLPLAGLPPAQAKELARKLLRPSVPEASLALIVRESEGHPLFLTELVRFTQSAWTEGAITLEMALKARIGQLDPRSRELLELAALAGRPHGSHVFAAALGDERIEEPARLLLASKLLRLRRGQELCVYHDRIRHAAVRMIAQGRLAFLHRRMAQTLASDPRGDVSEQARHWDLAGEAERAIDAYQEAARGAAEALAFVRAAQLSARALELLGDRSGERRRALMVQRADALAYAGRSAEAAALYQDAAAQTRGPSYLLLRSRAAQQLMLSADLRRGFQATLSVLRELGVSLPTSRLGVLLRILRDRLWMALPRRYVERPKRPEDERDHLAYEIIDQLMGALDVLHPPAMFILAVQQMRLTARLGIRDGVGRAHTLMGWFKATSGSLREAMPLFARGRELCAELGDPRISARQAYSEGSARLAGWDFVRALACLERAHALFQENVPDRPAMVTNARYHLGLGWYYTGEHMRLARESEIWLAQAREQGDRRALALLNGMGYGFLRHLMRDAPEQALSELARTTRDFPPEPFSFIHFGALIGIQTTLRYRGGSEALAWLDARKRAHARPLLLRTRLGRSTLALARCFALLAAMVDASPARRALYDEEAHATVRKLQREGAAFTSAYGDLMLAQLACVNGALDQAARYARASGEVARAHQLELVHGADFLLGVLEGGSAGTERKARVEAELRAQGWRDPRRAVMLHLPVLPLLVRDA